MSNFNLTYQKDGENEQLYYKDAHNNDLYIRSCEDFAPAIIQEKSGNPIAITDGADCPIRKLKVIFEPIQDGSGDPSPDNVRPITGRTAVTVWREAVYDPSADPALTIQLGQTVYGGTVDVTTGTMTVDRAMVDLGTLTWSNKAGTDGIFYSWSLQDVVKQISSTTTVSNAVCSALVIGTKSDVYDDMTADNAISVGYQGAIYARATKYSTAQEFVTAMSGVQLCYELATPLEITLDPATLSTLKGENTFSTDGTSIELEYVVDTKTYIDNLINSGKKTVVKPNDEIKIIDENKGVE